MPADASPAPDVFLYLDYRAYLDDWYAWKKSVQPTFSHRVFARLTGTRTHTVLINVTRHGRALSDAMAERFAKGMALDAESAAFFRLLVAYDNAPTMARKGEIWLHISGSRGFRRARGLEGAAAAYLAQWYIPVVRELAYRPDFRPDPEWVAERLLPPISPAEAAEALEVLDQLGMLVHGSDGKVRPRQDALVTATEMDRVVVWKYHHGMIQRALDALDELPGTERFYQSATVPVGVELGKRLRVEIRQFMERIVGMCEEERLTRGRAPGRVMQLNVQLLPVTRDLAGEPGGDGGK